jgi:hypothetical protein
MIHHRSAVAHGTSQSTVVGRIGGGGGMPEIRANGLHRKTRSCRYRHADVVAVYAAARRPIIYTRNSNQNLITNRQTIIIHLHRQTITITVKSSSPSSRYCRCPDPPETRHSVLSATTAVIMPRSCRPTRRSPATPPQRAVPHYPDLTTAAWAGMDMGMNMGAARAPQT